MLNLYYYKAKVLEVYDGDTITIDLDLGFNMWMHWQKVRLYGINAPELRGATKEAGIKARDFLRSFILGKDIVIESHLDRSEKYGRILGTIWTLMLTKDSKGVIQESIADNINSLMVSSGNAVSYMENE